MEVGTHRRLNQCYQDSEQPSLLTKRFISAFKDLAFLALQNQAQAFLSPPNGVSQHIVSQMLFPTELLTGHNHRASACILHRAFKLVATLI
jgi:hypothetical protein